MRWKSIRQDSSPGVRERRCAVRSGTCHPWAPNLNLYRLERLILYEDEHLLVVRKPPGINTHAATSYSGEGIYDWLRRREPRWADLALIQRLDKETSGVLLFSKSRRGNVSLTKQFSRRRVAKEYVLRTDRNLDYATCVVRSRIRKGRGRFESLAGDAEEDDEDPGAEAVTEFTTLSSGPDGSVVRAQPLTGRTHQIRIHAADSGFPILGDALYGGSAFHRLCLHARALRLRHPATNEPLEFLEEPDFTARPGQVVRASVVDRRETDAYRVVHGAADARPGWYVDALGPFILISADAEPTEDLPGWLLELPEVQAARGVYWRRLDRQVRASRVDEASPVRVRGEVAPESFWIRENGLRFEMSFAEGYSVGLFLDQRDNRRRLITNWVGPEFPVRAQGMAGAEVLNLFAYTCGFSVAAGAAGARTTSLDLSKKYLEWGRRNFAGNQLDPATQDFIYGDALEWLRRLAKKGRRFDVVLVDPPTFSQSRERGVFRIERDLPALVEAACRVAAPRGVLFFSTNAARLEPELFMEQVAAGVGAAQRTIERQLFVPQSPDFPTCRDEPGYLKTVWLRLRGESGGALMAPGIGRPAAPLSESPDA